MRVNPGTGRIYQLSPTSRMGSTPLPTRQTAPLTAKPAEKPVATKAKASFLDGVKSFFGKLTSFASNMVSGFFGLFSFSAKTELHAGGVRTQAGGGGSGTV